MSTTATVIAFALGAAGVGILALIAERLTEICNVLRKTRR